MKLNETISKLNKQYGCPVWTTSDGMLVPVTELEDGHLVNAYNMVVRTIESQDSNDMVMDPNEADVPYQVLTLAITWKRILMGEITRRQLPSRGI